MPDSVEEMRAKVAQVHEGMTSFATDMKAKGIHVGMGSPPFCVTCDESWPCSTERRAEGEPTRDDDV